MSPASCATHSRCRDCLPPPPCCRPMQQSGCALLCPPLAPAHSCRHWRSGPTHVCGPSGRLVGDSSSSSRGDWCSKTVAGGAVAAAAGVDNVAGAVGAAGAAAGSIGAAGRFGQQGWCQHQEQQQQQQHGAMAVTLTAGSLFVLASLVVSIPPTHLK
jgi:hypothetical protein